MKTLRDMVESEQDAISRVLRLLRVVHTASVDEGETTVVNFSEGILVALAELLDVCGMDGRQALIVAGHEADEWVSELQRSFIEGEVVSVQ